MLSQLTLRDQRIRDLLSLLSGGKSQPECGQSSDTWPLDLPLVGFSKRKLMCGPSAMLSKGF